MTPDSGQTATISATASLFGGGILFLSNILRPVCTDSLLHSKCNRETLERHENKSADRLKVRLATRLREEMTMTVKCIAERLAMGTAGYVNNRLHRWRG